MKKQKETAKHVCFLIKSEIEVVSEWVGCKLFLRVI